MLHWLLLMASQLKRESWKMSIQTEVDILIQNYPDLASLQREIEDAIDILVDGFKQGGKLLLCGNGGSSADSDHIVGELAKGFRKRRPLSPDIINLLNDYNSDMGTFMGQRLQTGLPAINLGAHSALISAVSNDIAPDLVFAQQVLAYHQSEHDMLIGISTSGNSANVVYACAVARALNMNTIGLSGASGGQMLDHCDVMLCVPYTETASVQERHLPIYHVLCTVVENLLFTE